MARNYKRDRRGRFARVAGLKRKVAGARANRLTRGIRERGRAEAYYNRVTGDRGTPAQRARYAAKTKKLQAKRNRLRNVAAGAHV
jgi:hypothetical protein